MSELYRMVEVTMARDVSDVNFGDAAPPQGFSLPSYRVIIERDPQAEANAALGAEIREELRRCGILTAAKATKEANWPTGNSSAVMYAVADVFRKEQANDTR